MSVGIKFLYRFSVGEYDLNNPGNNILSITSTAAGFDKKNLTTTPLREVWRSGSDISVWQEFIIEANDTEEAPDAFALLNHNLSESAVVQLQGSMTSDFSTPAFTLTLTWSEKHIVLLQDMGLAYNYYRFRILDPTNECGFIQIGRVIGGKAFTFADNEDITDDIQVQPEDLAYKTNTEGFFRAFNERVKVDKVSFRFSKLNTQSGENTNYLGLLELVKTVGETYPFLTIVDPSDQSFITLWGNIDRLPSRGFGINRYADLSMTIQEVY